MPKPALFAATVIQWEPQTPKIFHPLRIFPLAGLLKREIITAMEKYGVVFVERRRGRPVGRIYTASFRLMLQESVKGRFLAACERNGEEASTVLRNFMAQYAIWSELGMGYRSGMQFTFIPEPEQQLEGNSMPSRS